MLGASLNFDLILYCYSSDLLVPHPRRLPRAQRRVVNPRRGHPEDVRGQRARRLAEGPRRGGAVEAVPLPAADDLDLVELSLSKCLTTFWQTSRDSFSAVSKPIVASK